MALPVDGQLGAQLPAPFLPPGDRLKIPLDDWSRGGRGLNDSTRSLDLYDWYFRYDEDTRTFWVGAPGLVPEIAFYATPTLAVDIAGSFDTNMQPVLCWVDDDGAAWYRWRDPIPDTFVTERLPEGSYCVRVKLDDLRLSQQAAGVTDTIIAYIRDSMVYYRLLRDRFATEYLLAGSEGMVYLYQIGMNENLRFQFSRSGEFENRAAHLHFPRPPHRGVSRPIAFDALGDVRLIDDMDEPRSVAGRRGASTYRSRNHAWSLEWYVKRVDGTWPPETSRGTRANFFRSPASPMGDRLLQYGISADGTLYRYTDTQYTIKHLALQEVTAAGGRVLTGMLIAENGAGITFNVASIASGGQGTEGYFSVDYRTLADVSVLWGGSSSMRYMDDGNNVTMVTSSPAAATSTSARLRWPAGTIPPSLRPDSTRRVMVTLQDNGVTGWGEGEIYADGGAEFWPLKLEGAADLDHAYFPTSSTWTVPAGVTSVDMLLVGAGAGGGRGFVGPSGFPTHELIGGGGGGGGGQVYTLMAVPVTPGQVCAVKVGVASNIPSERQGVSGEPSGVTGIWEVPVTLPPGVDVATGIRNGAGGTARPVGGLVVEVYRRGAGGIGGGGGGGAGSKGAWARTLGGTPSNNYPGVLGYAGGGGGYYETRDHLVIGGGGGGGGGCGGAGAAGSDVGVGGAAGAGVTLTDVGFASASGTGAPATFGAGGGGGGAGGAGGAGGSSVGGAGHATSHGANASAGTGSGGGGGGMHDGFGGCGSNGFVLLRWGTDASTGQYKRAEFTVGGDKGLAPGCTIRYVKRTPQADVRGTEAGDTRITEDGGRRRGE